MKLVKFQSLATTNTVGLLEGDEITPLSFSSGQYKSLFDILDDDDPARTAQFLIDPRAKRLSLDQVTVLPPIDRQEVWAAGVTYRRSKTARMEESAGAASFYDLVYEAPRPELFFKANPHRVVGHQQPVRIRRDARWNVPEPELTLVLSSRLRLVGFTVGNDMSSRDIEGENPLYLPQAKVYDGCCALGPCVTLLDWMPSVAKTGIEMLVQRGGAAVFQGKTSASQMVRSYDDLIDWLGIDNSFPHGAFLLTGTGIVPGNDFTLRPGDAVRIAIDGIGTLANTVVQG